MLKIGDKVKVISEPWSQIDREKHNLPRLRNRVGEIIDIITVSPISKSLLDRTIYVLAFKKPLLNVNNENKWALTEEYISLQS